MSKIMNQKPEDFSPFQSVVLTQHGKHVDKGLIAKCLKDAETILTKRMGRTVISIGKPCQRQKKIVGWLILNEKSEPTWSVGSGLTDSKYQLVLFVGLRSYCSIFSSESSWRSQLVNALGDSSYPGLQEVDLVSSRELNGAFIEKELRTLWLSGTHTSIDVKPDSKVLSGLDLGKSLDPFDDQSFCFSAARANSNIVGIDRPMGLAPRKSLVWAGPSKNWKAFADWIEKVVARLEVVKGKGTDSPIPILASAVITTPSNVGDCVTIDVVPFEQATRSGPTSVQSAQYHQEFQDLLVFEVLKTNSNNVFAAVRLAGEKLGELAFDFDWMNPTEVSWTVKWMGNPPQCEEGKRILQFCRKRYNLKWVFDEGYSIVDAAIHELRLRDQEFDGWKVDSFADYEITMEKPDNSKSTPEIKSIEDATQSNTRKATLFNWVYDRFKVGPKGDHVWLACDDGQDEQADFVRLLIKNSGESLFELIHVKSAEAKKDGSVTGNVTASKYEVVVGQAVGKLKYLDPQTSGSGLIEKFKKNTKKGRRIVHTINNSVWYDGKRVSRSGMVKAMNKLKLGLLRRRVTIVQPHVSKKKIDATRKSAGQSKTKFRLKQLDNLMCSARNACSGLGAEFNVWIKD